MTIIDHKSTIVGTCMVLEHVDPSNIETDTYEQCNASNCQWVHGEVIGHLCCDSIPHNLDYMASIEGPGC